MSKVYINSQPNVEKLKSILGKKNFSLENDHLFLINSITNDNIDIYGNDLFFQSKHFIGDKRYIESLNNGNINKNIQLFEFNNILKNINFENKIRCIKSLGRDGFSTNYINGAFHACQSFYVILQVSILYNPEEIICIGPNYTYGVTLNRINHLSENIPDFFITETHANIIKFARPNLNRLNIKLTFINSIFE